MIFRLANLTDAERWAAGLVVLLVIGGIAQWLNHFWSNKRNASERLIDAAAAFRSAIYAAVAPIPATSSHWGAALAALPTVCQNIGAAVALFGPYLGSKRRSFDAEWQILKRHCNETIPEALSTPNVLYGKTSRGPDPTAAKEKFHIHVRKLLSYAEDA